MATESPPHVHTVVMHFIVFDEDAFNMALEDLENAEVFGEGEGPGDNSTEENLDILVCHLDVLANYRGLENIAFYDVGIERVTR
jgi:hypothetical protein